MAASSLPSKATVVVTPTDKVVVVQGGNVRTAYINTLTAPVPAVISGSRSLQSSDSGSVIDLTTGGLSLTVPAGLVPSFACALLVKGNTSIVSAGGVLLNGATSTLVRSDTNDTLIRIQATSTQDSYKVTGGLSFDPSIFSTATPVSTDSLVGYTAGGATRLFTIASLAAAQLVPPLARTGTTYTLVLTDAASAVEVNNASANTVTVPLNSSVAFPIGTVIEVAQIGAGQTTIVATGGVTIQTSTSLSLRAQYSTCSLRKRGTDVWILSGDMA